VSLDEYQTIADVLVEMAALLELDITRLSVKSPKVIAPDIDLIHDKNDQVVKLCAQAVAQLLDREDCKRILVHKEVLAQLRGVAEKMHITWVNIRQSDRMTPCNLELFTKLNVSPCRA